MARLSRWLLERVLAPELVGDVLGDLEERSERIASRRGPDAARVWYRREALRLCLRPSLLRRPTVPAVGTALREVPVHVRMAFRLMRRDLPTSIAIIVTLAVGIGSVAAVFSAIDRFLVRMPDGMAEPERLVEIYRRPLLEQHARAPGYDGYLVLTVNAFEAVRESGSLEGAVLTSPGWMLSAVIEGDEPERLEAMFVSAGYFELLGARPFVGTVFDAAHDDVAGASPVAVITHAFWQRRFGGSAGVLGRSIRIEGREFTVVGVMRRDFAGTSVARSPDVWLPLSTIEAIPLWGARAASTGMYIGVGRLASNVTLAHAQAELDRLGREYYGDAQVTFRLAPLSEVTVDPNRRAGFVSAGTALFASVLLLLVIACFNVANLQLARSAVRRREFAVRLSLGAGPGRLLRQVFTESAVPFVIGSVAGFGLLAALRPYIGGWRPPNRFFFSNPALDLPIDLRVVGFTLLATGAVATVFAMLPAIRAASVDPRVNLAAVPGRRPGRGLHGQDLLVALQVAACMVALVCAGLFLRGLNAARAIDPGFDPHGVGMVSVNLHYDRLPRDRQHTYYRRAIDEARTVPGVIAAGITWQRPLEFSPVYAMYARLDAPPEERYTVRATAITPGFLDAVGMPLISGRDFLATDRSDAGTPPSEVHYVVILNERAAELAYPGVPLDEVVGRRIHGGFVAGTFAEVVGIVPTGRQVTIGEQPTPAVFTSLEQMRSVPTATLFFRSSLPVESVLGEVAARLRAIDANVPIHDVEPATALVDRSLWGARASARLLAFLGAIGLFLASLGVYGVVSGMVGQQRREIGVRIALGARAGPIHQLVIGRVLRVVLVGILLGTGAVLASGRIIAGLLYGVRPNDPVTLTVVCVCLLAASLLAAYLPARRAGRVDPLEVLRAD